MKTKSIDENGDVLSTLTETLKSPGLGDFGFFFWFFFYLFICLLACAVLNVDIDIKKKFKPHKISLMNSSQYGSYCLTKKNEM